MPAEMVHLTALREALASPRIDAGVRRRAVRREDAAKLGAVLVDLPYFHRYVEEVVRYAIGAAARPSAWGTELHDGGAIALLGGVLEVARRRRDDTIAATAIGLASHLAIDRALHPLINALARRHPVGKDHGSAHREVEKFQSICFHERYHGRDLMGTDGIRHYLAIHAVRHLDEPALGGAIREAFELAFGRAPGARELVGFGRGYHAHARLLGSFVGGRIASERDKERARPIYLHGAWGDFEALLERAIAASIPALEAAAAVLDATTRELEAARAALARVLPPGSIDPMGEDVDLNAPFEVRAA
ncbi:MAG TPA: hypothetical protein VL463_27085 [Kofleriaceae bacterium]|jgi:hypothetical protein|nr:hypothetical protein [Kofleriaceae bacterium]